MLSLFAVETLDTRLWPSSDPAKVAKVKSNTCPARWFTKEFSIYWLCFLVCVPLMIKAPMDVSRPDNPNYSKFADLLTPGWLGRPVDNSDSQYSNFRDIFPALVGLLIGHQLLRRVVSLSPLAFDAFFGVILIACLHGIGAIKILTILGINYALPRNPKVQWAFSVGILFANELLHGYPLGSLIPCLDFFEHWGLMPRWQVFFKCTMMRMLSFTLDRNHVTERDDMFISKESPSVDVSTESQRISVPLSAESYNFVSYLAYCLYAPLYVAGPIISFNDYFRQRALPLSSASIDRTVRYGVRFIVCIFTMELLIHYCYVVAITSTRAWHGSTPAQVSMIALFNLVHIWLKLLIPWRFFRLWALVDGIDPPENMVRCVANNYSAMLFWRSWHRSFNRWVIRYLYVPIGGNKRPLINTAIVFSFVAIWHDINPRLLVWSWLIVLFVTPEMVAAKLLPAKKYGHCWWYRHVCALGAVLNIWMMMIANLVGFAVGPDGIKDMLYDMSHTAAGLGYSIFASCMLYVGAQVMFETREREHRAGIDLKC